MKTKLILATGAGLALAVSACSSDDGTYGDVAAQVQSNKAEITYDVTAQRASRAAAIYNSNVLPKQFHVASWVIPEGADKGSEFIAWDLVKDTAPASGHNWVAQGDKRYWPTGNEALNFFATNAVSGTFEVPKDATPSFQIPFTANAAPELQQDLLYAATYNQHRDSTSTSTQAVALDFHHALSQIAFMGKCQNKNLEVDIESISLVGVNPGGTLNLPSTDDDVTWIASKSAPATYTVLAQTPEAGAVTLGSEASNLTSAANQADQALMLMPQTVTAANPSDFQTGGAYLVVMCQIWNMANPTAGLHPTTDIQIIGHEDGGIYRSDPIYIPVNIDWQMGKRYVYTLNFGTGHGGYDKNGNLILRDISYTVTADDWQNVSAGVTQP